MRLQEWMALYNMTMREVAEEAQTTIPTIQRLMQGKGATILGVVHRISLLTDGRVKVKDLMTNKKSFKKKKKSDIIKTEDS